MGGTKWWRRPRPTTDQPDDAVMLDRLERLVESGTRVELDHGKGDGFLAGTHVGPSLRAALADLVAESSG